MKCRFTIFQQVVESLVSQQVTQSGSVPGSDVVFIIMNSYWFMFVILRGHDLFPSPGMVIVSSVGDSGIGFYSISVVWAVTLFGVIQWRSFSSRTACISEGLYWEALETFHRGFIQYRLNDFIQFLQVYGMSFSSCKVFILSISVLCVNWGSLSFTGFFCLFDAPFFCSDCCRCWNHQVWHQ